MGVVVLVEDQIGPVAKGALPGRAGGCDLGADLARDTVVGGVERRLLVRAIATRPGQVEDRLRAGALDFGLELARGGAHGGRREDRAGALLLKDDGVPATRHPSG